MQFSPLPNCFRHPTSKLFPYSPHFFLPHNAMRYLQQTREEEVIDTQRSELGQFSLSAAQLGLVFPFWKRWGTESTEILTTSASTSLIFSPRVLFLGQHCEQCEICSYDVTDNIQASSF